jgi:hypothetical protein
MPALKQWCGARLLALLLQAAFAPHRWIIMAAVEGVVLWCC